MRTSAQALSKSATKFTPLRLTASSALANGSSLLLNFASLLPHLALSSTGPGLSHKLMSRSMAPVATGLPYLRR
ncbi:hypothetical protein ACFX14_002910 [Malus domestica]